MGCGKVSEFLSHTMVQKLASGLFSLVQAQRPHNLLSCSTMLLQGLRIIPDDRRGNHTCLYMPGNWSKEGW